jgi:hypothetical protein
MPCVRVSEEEEVTRLVKYAWLEIKLKKTEIGSDSASRARGPQRER